MEHMKFYVHSWEEVSTKEDMVLVNDDNEEYTVEVDGVEIINFESTEFATLEDAKSHYNALNLSERVGAIYYECAEQFEGLKPYKHSQTPNAEQEAKADADIAACIAACEADGNGE